MNKRFFQYGLCLMLLTLCLLLTACGKGGASAPGASAKVNLSSPSPPDRCTDRYLQISYRALFGALGLGPRS